ncbi:uncharacterized protein TNCV_3398061 [Trichonephila clavipes]|nr:uncharacterized protein TNCV_3398061 [Trichonephila clavipes]
MYIACVAWGTLNSRRAASPIVRLVEWEERWEISDHPHSVLPLNWGGIEPNRTVTCMMLKATANDSRHLALCHDEFRGPRSGLCRSGGRKVSSIFFPSEDSTRITLSGTFRFITEKNTPPFLWCPRLMFSAPQYPVFPAGCSQRLSNHEDQDDGRYSNFSNDSSRKKTNPSLLLIVGVVTKVLMDLAKELALERERERNDLRI